MVSGSVTYFFKHKEMRKSAEIDYEYEQKKKLSNLIGAYHGRLVASASRFSNRMGNLYRNDEHAWIHVRSDYDNSGYYFRSTIYRFMELFSILREVEKEALLLDTRIAGNEDFKLINYVTALNWLMTVSELLNEFPDGISEQDDHFYSDNLRKYCDLVMVDGKFPDIDNFCKNITADSKIDAVLKFFDGVTKNEERKRWDRLVCVNLLLLSFLNSFGHPIHKKSSAEITSVADELKNPKTRKVFAAQLKKYDLENDKNVRILRKILLK